MCDQFAKTTNLLTTAEENHSSFFFPKNLTVAQKEKKKKKERKNGMYIMQIKNIAKTANIHQVGKKYKKKRWGRGIGYRAGEKEEKELLKSHDARPHLLLPTKEAIRNNVLFDISIT